jgi:ABC-type cobalamin/Fe3+-siderophores transport system ATPase subunit
MLIIVSGPDRVGKSTLIKRMADVIGSHNVEVVHHGPPPQDQENIFDFYRKDVEKWAESGKELAIFDRAWPCSYILEQHRRRNAGHFEDVIDFEIWLNDLIDAPVVHLAQFRPWCWSAPLHIEELKEEGFKGWMLRDEYIARMQEHRVYTEQLQTFYEDITMFPNVQLTQSTEGNQAIALCQQALRSLA